jgi:hypothetical protein
MEQDRQSQPGVIEDDCCTDLMNERLHEAQAKPGARIGVEAFWQTHAVI